MVEGIHTIVCSWAAQRNYCTEEDFGNLEFVPLILFYLYIKKNKNRNTFFYHVPPPYFLTFRRHWNLYVVAVILKGHDLSWLWNPILIVCMCFVCMWCAGFFPLFFLLFVRPQWKIGISYTYLHKFASVLL